MGDHPADGPDEQLLVFGYPCRLFDAGAENLADWNRDRQLIALNDDPDVMVDRFDCRLQLPNVELYKSSVADVTPSHDEEVLESFLDAECFKDLAQEDTENTERPKEAEIPYNYDCGQSSLGSPSSPQDKQDEEAFVPPPELKVPKGVVAPTSAKMHLIIEKTALLIATHGSQMEIIVNIKQKNNKEFRFLDWNHPLHIYYKHVLRMIKDKRYTPVHQQQRKVEKEEADSSGSDDDDDYLHPSLRGTSTMSGLERKVNLTPKIDYSLTEANDMYSELYKGLVSVCPELAIADAQPEKKVVKDEEEEEEEESGHNAEGISCDEPRQFVVVPPPPDLQPVIDRFAEYVARNGPEFEYMVRMKREPRFSFIETDSPYHAYYQARVQWYQYEDIVSRYNQGMLTPADVASLHLTSYVFLPGKPVEDGQSSCTVASETENLEESASVPPGEEEQQPDVEESIRKSLAPISFSIKSVPKANSNAAVIYSEEESDGDAAAEQTPGSSEKESDAEPCTPGSPAPDRGKDDDPLETLLEEDAARPEVTGKDDMIKMERRERAKLFLKTVMRKADVESNFDDTASCSNRSSAQEEPTAASVKRSSSNAMPALPASYKIHIRERTFRRRFRSSSSESRSGRKRRSRSKSRQRKKKRFHKHRS